MKSFRLMVTLAVTALLTACGGGEEVTNNYYPAATPPAAQTPVAVVDDAVTLVVSADPIAVNAGIGYEVIIQVTCSVDANGWCKKPAVVKDLTSTIGRVEYLSYQRGGNTLYVNQLVEGEVFIPNASLVFDRPDQITVYLATSPAATLGTVPLKLVVNTTYGQVKVVGAPRVTIANGPVEVSGVMARDFGPGDGTSREVATVTFLCPPQVTCKVPQGFTTWWQSTAGTKPADVTIAYQYPGGGLGYGRQVEVSGVEWTMVDFSWGGELTFTGELRVSVSTNLSAGKVEISSPQMTDELGRQLYIKMN